VVEERNARGDLRTAMSVDRELDLNIRFSGDTVSKDLPLFAYNPLFRAK